jgi:hypothetical protein
MKIKFDLLFEVVFEHEYFKNGLIQELNIQPTQVTTVVLKNYGLLFKRTKRGFVVLYEIDTANPAESPLRPIISQEKFSFELYMYNTYFTNYTNIPLSHKYPDFFYFNNLTENIVNTDLLLNKHNYAGTDNIVELVSNICNIIKPTGNTSSLLTIDDLSGKTVFSKSILTQDGDMIYQLNFDKIGSGRYDIKIDGALYKKVYSDKETSRKSLFGIIDIFKSDMVPASYRYASSDGTVSKKEYKIKFARRNTTWKYFVILKNINSDPGLYVSYGTKISGEEIYPDTVKFNKTPATEPELTDTYGSNKVFLFESDKELPLYEVPKKNIRLLKPDTEDKDADPDVIVGNLPNAPCFAIKTNSANNKTFSEIFIYV